MPDDALFLVSFPAPATVAGRLEDYAAFRELALVTTTHPESDRAEIQVFADSAADAERIRALLAADLDAWLGTEAPAPAELTVCRLAREDWAETWKRFFHVLHVTPRLTVKPSWEAHTAAPGEVVLELDPGMSFGTGYHGTTRACLEFIEELSARCPGAAFLDAGCGSGILALAAWKLGFRPVRAFDNDPQAVLVACENLARNGVADVELQVAELAEFGAPRGVRVVVANILAPVLIEHAARLAAFLDPAAESAFLIASGILHEQYPAVRAAFEGCGFREERTRSLDEWTSGLFLRRR